MYNLLLSVHCLLSAVCGFLSAVCWLLSAVYSLFSKNIVLSRFWPLKHIIFSINNCQLLFWPLYDFHRHGLWINDKHTIVSKTPQVWDRTRNLCDMYGFATHYHAITTKTAPVFFYTHMVKALAWSRHFPKRGCLSPWK